MEQVQGSADKFMQTKTPIPPGPKRKLLELDFFKFRRNPVRFIEKLVREYGDIVNFRLGPQEVFLLNRPEHVKDVLVTHNDNFMKGRALQRSKRLLGEGLLTSEGEFHRRQKRLASPAFHRQHIASYGAVMADYAARMRERWRDGETLDISQEMMQLTLNIVGKTLFDADVEDEAQEIGEAMNSLMELFDLLLMPFTEYLEKLPFPQSRRFQKVKDRLDATVYRMIEERRRSGKDHGDLLSMLLLAQDEEGETGGMTDTQVRDEAITIFLAGHETTANAMTWTWYLLSQNREAEAKLHAELDAVLGGRLPATDDVPQLKYTEMVMAESMRLFPPAWAVGRMALDDYEVGGYVVPKGALILLSPYAMHHDARFYRDPERFDPQRWTPEAREARPPYAYFPFGGGVRRCIGEGFAWMEGILLIATIAQKWRMRLVPNHPIELRPVITLRPKHGMRMTVHERELGIRN